MLLGRPIYAACALAIAMVATGFPRLARGQEDRSPAGNLAGQNPPLSGPASSYSVPGPNWLEDSTAPVPSGPQGDGWLVNYPFKYYPGGYPATGGYADATLLIPPEEADQCFCTPPPCYFGTFYLDVLILDRRNNLDGSNLYFDNAGNATLTTSDFNFDTEAGIRFGVLLPSTCGNDWSFEYFGISSFQDSISRGDALGMTAQFYGQTQGPFTSLTAQYESKLDSLEFCVRSRQMRRLAPLAGIRFLRLDESFNSLTDPAGQTGQFSDAENDLFGFQFGCQSLLFDMGRWRLESIVKGGPYVNDIDIDVQVDPANPATGTKHIDHWHTSFVGDLRIGLNCRLGPLMTFRFGYQALWLEGVATAPNQNNEISFATNRETVDLNGVIYQGGYLGMDLSW